MKKTTLQYAVEKSRLKNAIKVIEGVKEELTDSEIETEILSMFQSKAEDRIAQLESDELMQTINNIKPNAEIEVIKESPLIMILK